MLKAYKSYIDNFLISKYNISKSKNLPIFLKLKIYIRYKKKTIYLILTTFFLLYSLSDYKPKLCIKKIKNTLKSSRKLVIFLNSEKIYTFLYKFVFFFWRYNTIQKSFLHFKKNVRIFFYNLQVLYLEFFFLQLQNATWANFNFKLEFLFSLINHKELKYLLLKNFFQAYKLIKN